MQEVGVLEVERRADVAARRQRDHAGAVRALQRRQEPHEQLEVADVIDRELRLEPARIARQRRGHDAGVVDQQVERALGMARRERVDRRRGREVHRLDHDVRELAECPARLREVARRDDDLRPRGGEHARGLEADAGVAAGHDRELAVEPAVADHLARRGGRAEAGGEWLLLRHVVASHDANIGRARGAANSDPAVRTVAPRHLAVWRGAWLARTWLARRWGRACYPTCMTSDYVPPNVWVWNKENGGQFASINRPIAGPTHDQELPVGKHPFQLYSLATPNGQKVTIMFEELLAAGHRGAEYDAWLIKIHQGDQFGSGFVAVNPNSKIPALVDRSGATPIRVFESGAILVHLAEKFGAFLPTEPAARAECMSWLFWQMGAAPFLGGGFGHFYAYAPVKIEYAIDRFAMEVKRQLDVLDKRLAMTEYLAGDAYTIADIATWPWYGELARGRLYKAGEFLAVHEYTHVVRWANAIAERVPVRRGQMVNRVLGDPEKQLAERHDAADLDAKLR